MHMLLMCISFVGGVSSLQPFPVFYVNATTGAEAGKLHYDELVADIYSSM